MDIRPLTLEQQRFAEKNHDLVHAFLKKKELPESVFYDIVVFGYLKAVQEYCDKPSLHKYAFSTLSWRRMQGALSNYYKYLSRPKRCAPTVSFEAAIGDEDGLGWDDVIGRHDDLMERLEVELLLHELASKLPRREMNIVQMRARGERMHDIAKAEHLTFHDINALLERIYESVIREFLDWSR